MKVPCAPYARSPKAGAAISSPCTPSDTPVGPYVSFVTGVLIEELPAGVAATPIDSAVRTVAPSSRGSLIFISKISGDSVYIDKYPLTRLDGWSPPESRSRFWPLH